MSMADRGIFITALSVAWDSDEPGTLPKNLDISAKLLGIQRRTFENFLKKFPKCFEVNCEKLVNHKLHEMWLNYKAISEKRAKSAQIRWDANALQMDMQTACSASASASASANTTPIPPNGGHRFDLKYSPDFLMLWRSYPRKDGKGAAWRAYKKLRPKKEQIDIINNSIMEHRRTEEWKKENGQFIPHLSTYLNQRRWEDEEDS